MKGIGFQHFKALAEKSWFSFKPITVLTGTNNSGKSSVLDGMKFLQENCYEKGIDNLLIHNFKLSDIWSQGSLRSFFHQNANGEIAPTFYFFQQKEIYEYRIGLTKIENNEIFAHVSSFEIKDTSKDIIFFKLNREANREKTTQVSINYQYVVDRVSEQITNSLQFNTEVRELENKINGVNSGQISIDEVKNQKLEIQAKYNFHFEISNSINIHNVSGDWKIVEPDLLPIDDHLEVTYPIFPTECKILIQRNLKSWRDWGITDKSIENDFLSFKNNQFINFGYLWQQDRTEQNAFESLIKECYKESDINKAYEKVNHDIIYFISNLTCTYENTVDSYSSEIFTSKFVNFINSFCDFGFVSSLFSVHGEKYNKAGNLVISNCNSYIKTDFSGDKEGFSAKAGTFGDIIVKLNDIFSKIISEKCIADNRIALNTQKSDELLQNIFHTDFKKCINNYIDTLICDINLGFECTFISSKRHPNSNINHLLDKSDFSRQLLIIENSDNKESKYEFINRWLKIFEIADSFEIIADKEIGMFKAYLVKNRQRILVNNYGLGTNQLLPILFSLAVFTENYEYDSFSREVNHYPTLVIEEPESNLHPAMQSKLADLFAEAIYKLNVNIIIETHSEYIIRKLQYLVASNTSSLKSKDVIVYYIHKNEKSSSVAKKIQQIQIDEFGRLSNEFGSGFFDEADRIATEVFLLNTSQSN